MISCATSWSSEYGATEDDEGGIGDDNLRDGGKSNNINAKKNLKWMKANFKELCEVNKILVFFKRH